MKGSTTIERCLASAGVASFEATGAGGPVAMAAGRFAMNKYHPPAAITMSKAAAIPATSGASAGRFFGAEGFAGVTCFAWAGTPTCSE